MLSAGDEGSAPNAPNTKPSRGDCDKDDLDINDVASIITSMKHRSHIRASGSSSSRRRHSSSHHRHRSPSRQSSQSPSRSSHKRSSTTRTGKSKRISSSQSPSRSSHKRSSTSPSGKSSRISSRSPSRSSHRTSFTSEGKNIRTSSQSPSRSSHQRRSCTISPSENSRTSSKSPSRSSHHRRPSTTSPSGKNSQSHDSKVKEKQKLRLAEANASEIRSPPLFLPVPEATSPSGKNSKSHNAKVKEKQKLRLAEANASGTVPAAAAANVGSSSLLGHRRSKKEASKRNSTSPVPKINPSPLAPALAPEDILDNQETAVHATTSPDISEIIEAARRLGREEGRQKEREARSMQGDVVVTEKDSDVKKKCIIVATCFIVLLLIAGGITASLRLMARGNSSASNGIASDSHDPSRDADTPSPTLIESKTPSTSPTFSDGESDNCFAIANGEAVEGQGDMPFKEYDILLDVTLDSGAVDLESVTIELQEKIQRFLMPALVGCFDEGQQSKTGIMNAFVNAQHDGDERCLQESESPCYRYAIQLDLHILKIVDSADFSELIMSEFQEAPLIERLGLEMPFVKITVVTTVALTPSASPSGRPSTLPTRTPSISPSEIPSGRPSVSPSARPTTTPVSDPTLGPTQVPTPRPTRPPTPFPTRFPTPGPTRLPTPFPTRFPTPGPTRPPTPFPTRFPTPGPTQPPTPSPTRFPTPGPTQPPTSLPTSFPTPFSSLAPSSRPTDRPSCSPTLEPTLGLPPLINELYCGCLAEPAPTRTFPFKVRDWLTQAQCLRECSNRGYKYWALQFDYECRCSNDTTGGIISDNCDMKCFRGGSHCYGDIKTSDRSCTCGSAWVNSVFRTSKDFPCPEAALLRNDYATATFNYQREDFPASNAIDGNEATMAHSAIATTSNVLPVFLVDLGVYAAVTKITFVNRQDCCQDRMEGVKLEILDVDQNVISGSERTLALGSAGSLMTEDLTFSCISGARFIRLTGASTAYQMNFAEIKAYGRAHA